VTIVADENTDTLSDFMSRKKFEAQKGQFGMGQHCCGKDGEDLVLLVPPGTTVSTVEADGEKIVLAELMAHGDQFLVAKGGRGGYGNAHFKSSTRQAPDFAELGEPGEQRTIHLELKLVADIGIIGYPSVGKSTIISVISAARPKIADYPFTTLVPNLGVVHVHDRSFVVCDVPGLIEGASQGKGLGHEFLRHIERCGALLHVLDCTRALVDGRIDASMLLKDYRAIRHELSAYSPALARKRELVVLNKADIVNFETRDAEDALRAEGVAVFLTISSATKHNVDEMIRRLLPIVLEEREKRDQESLDAVADQATSVPVLRPHLESMKMGAYRVERRQDGTILITGRRLQQFTHMTDFSNDSARRRFLDVVDRIGLRRAVRKLRAQAPGEVYIGSVSVGEYIE
jgi:GTP-binding protein